MTLERVEVRFTPRAGEEEHPMNDTTDPIMTSGEMSRFCLNVARKLSEIRAGAPPHAILEVGPKANAVEVRDAFRRQAKAFHPDTNSELLASAPGIDESLEEIFRALTEARKAMIGHSGALRAVSAPKAEAAEARPARAPGAAPAPPPASREAGEPAPAPPRPGAEPRPQRKTKREKTAAEFYAEGLKSLAARDRVTAAADFGEAVARAPEDAEYRRALGEALAQIPGREAEAVEALSEAARLDPRGDGALYLLGELYERQKLLDEAAAAFRRVIDRSPSHLKAKMGLARVEAARKPAAAPPSGLLGRLRRIAVR